MKHKVYISFENSKVFASHSWRNRYQKDFVSWLTETFGTVAGGMWGTEPAPAGIRFKFREPSHAMVFKLTWGGS